MIFNEVHLKGVATQTHLGIILRSKFLWNSHVDEIVKMPTHALKCPEIISDNLPKYLVHMKSYSYKQPEYVPGNRPSSRYSIQFNNSALLYFIFPASIRMWNALPNTVQLNHSSHYF